MVGTELKREVGFQDGRPVVSLANSLDECRPVLRRECSLDELQLSPRLDSKDGHAATVSKCVSPKRRNTLTKRAVTAQFVAHEWLAEGEDLTVRRSEGFFGRFVVHPTARRRFLWDIAGILIMLYDTVTIPLQVFDLHGTDETYILGKVSMGYWTIDIPLSFFVGYFQKGILEMRPSRIAARYMSTWMPLDVSIVLLDWTVQILTAGDSEGVGAKSTHLARVSRTLRAMRILRSLRLLRLLKLRHLMDEIQDRINSEYVHVVLRIVKLIIAIAMLNHFIACLWYKIGSSDGWVEENGQEDASVEYLYTSSLHWSLTQFTPASMEIVPTNTMERTFAVIVLLFAMIIFSSFVSSITTTMTHLGNLSAQLGKTKQFNKLRWYLRDHGVTTVLAVRIQKYLESAVKDSKGRVKESDVELLDMLSVPLRMELRHIIISPTITVHPFFRGYGDTSLQAMRQVCHAATSEAMVWYGDLMFTANEVAKRMYFLTRGRLAYAAMHRAESGETGNVMDVKLVEPGRWVCELALWFQWTHKGELYGVKHSDLILVEAERFMQVTANQRTVFEGTKRYAKAVLGHIQRRAGHVTDLGVEGLDIEALVHDSFEMASQSSARSTLVAASSPSTDALAACRAPELAASKRGHPIS